MVCRIDHAALGAIPKALCRVCHPREAAPPLTEAEMSDRKLKELEHELSIKSMALEACRSKRNRERLAREIEHLSKQIAKLL